MRHLGFRGSCSWLGANSHAQTHGQTDIARAGGAAEERPIGNKKEASAASVSGQTPKEEEQRGEERRERGKTSFRFARNLILSGPSPCQKLNFH